jgi:GTP cyclohydrolase-4
MFPDVQTRLPEIKMHLTRVGVSNVKKLLKIPTKGKPIILLANFKCFVDLPPSQKGTHMSRNLEAINELIEEIVKKPVYRLESLCEDIAIQTLAKHDYASTCEVEMESDLMAPQRTPLNRKEQNFFRLIARAKAYRKKIEKEIGAEIKGMLSYSKDIHLCTQRAKASLLVQVPDAHSVNIKDIVNILESSLSARAYCNLSEEEEKIVLKKAFSSPKFADGVVDQILKSAAEKLDLPHDMKISARCVVEDVLFTHDSYVERQATFGELR